MPAAARGLGQLRPGERAWLIAGAVVVTALAIGFYAQERRLVLGRAQEQLGAIAELTARRIAGRLTLHTRHTEGTIGALDLAVAVANHDQRHGANLEEWIRREELLGIATFDERGRPLASAGNVPAEGEELTRLLDEARRSGQSAWSEASRAPSLGDSLAITLAVPLTVSHASASRISGFVIVSFNLSRDIAEVMRWRFTNSSTEFVLVRHTTDRILFLSASSPHGAAPPMSLPLSTPGLAAARVFAGESTGTDARDFRGNLVAFAAAPVPGTTWTVLTKMTVQEALLPARNGAWMSLVLLVLISAGLIHLGIINHRREQAERQVWETSKALELEISRRRFDLLSRAVNECVVLLDSDWKIADVNERCVALFGRQREELLGRPIDMLRSPRSANTSLAAREQVLRDGSLRFESEILRPDGTIVPVEISARTAEWGGHTLVQSVYSDITERKLAEATTRTAFEKQQLAASIFESSSEAMLITDPRNVIIDVNPAFTRVTGYAREDVIGRDPSLLSSGRQSKEFYADLWKVLSETGHWEGEVWNRRKSGEIYAEWLVITTLRDAVGTVRNYIAQFSDITERKQAGEIIWRHANFDGLTGLPNRRLFHDRLKQDVKRSRRAGHRLALLFADLDRFKEVNDVLGHRAGDEILVQAAARLVGCVRDSDTVARLGGDEFTIILNDVPDAALVTQLVEKMTAALSQAYEIGSERVHLTASIGIATCPQDGEDADVLLQHADQAMYRAKKSGGSRYSFFTPAMHEETQRHHRLAQDLYEALAREEFEVFYQPIVDLPSGQIREAEALIRWKHPTLGMLAPGLFIPIAEEVGLIRDVGDWVFKESLRQAVAWQSITPPGFRIAVNISPAQLMHRNGSVPLLGLLEAGGGAGSQMVLEITEGLLLSDRPDIEKALDTYRKAGMRIAIDDFGTGYSSLSYLAKFHLDYVKIDRAFISQLHVNSPSLSLSEAIIVMAHKLGLSVIAEGIETEEQRTLLIAAGCDQGQGFLYSKPVPAAQFEALLARSMADCLVAQA